MKWRLGNSGYIFGVIYYAEVDNVKYYIMQNVEDVVLILVEESKSYHQAKLKSYPNSNLDAVNLLKEYAEWYHQKEQNIIYKLIKVGRSSTCSKNKVGCIIMKDGEIISSAANGAPVMLEDADMLYQTILHAEERAILRACNVLDSILYTTLSPCIRCAAKIIESGIKEVKYLFEYSEIYPIKYLEDNAVNVEKISHNLSLKPFNLEEI